MISHIIRAVAARLCARCFYWKYQEEAQGRAVFLFQPGLEGGGGAERLRGRDNRQCSGQRSSFHGGRPSCEGLRLAVEVGREGCVCVCAVCARGEGSRGKRWGPLRTPASPSPSLRLPVQEDRRPQRKESWGEQVKGEGVGEGERCRLQGRLKGWGGGVEGGSHCTLASESSLSRCVRAALSQASGDLASGQVSEPQLASP